MVHTTARGVYSAFETLPQYLISSYGTQLCDFETTDGWAKISGNDAALNASEFKTGSKSLKFTAESTYRLTGVTWDFGATDVFELWVYKHSGSGSSLWIYFSHSAENFTNGYKVAVNSQAYHTGWCCVRVGKADFSKLGSGSWSDPMVSLGIVIGGGDCVYSLDDLRVGVTGYGGCCLTIDDSFADQYLLAYPTFALHNTRHTGYITGDVIGTSQKLSAVNIATLHSAGCIMGNHSDTHADFTELNQTQIETEITDCAAAVAAAEGGAYAAVHVGPPYGRSDADVQAAYAALGVLTSRHAISGYPETHCLETLPLLEINGPDAITSETALATVTDILDIAKRRLQVVLFAFHSVVAEGATGNQITVATLHDILAYIAAIDMYHLTIEDIYRLTLGSHSVRRPI